MKTNGIVFRSANEPALEELDVPVMRRDEVLVRTRYSGVSIGTEQSIFSGARTHNGTFPVVTGYMTTGVIEAVGDDVKDLSPGDEVATGGARLDGPINSVWGAHMARRVVGSQTVYRLPSGVSMSEAAMWVMPAVGLNAMDMVDPPAGATVLIQGQGLIGQFFGQFARHRGCRVITIEPDERRAALSRRYVTEHVLDPRSGDLVEAVERLTDGAGADYVVEATGAARLMRQASSLLREHGRFVFLGWYPGEITLEYHHFHANSVVAYFPMGSGGAPVARRVLEALGEGVLKMGENITDIVPYQQACDGFRRIVDGDRSILGMVIDWSEA